MQKDVTISWSTFDHGSKVTIPTAVQLTASSVKCERGVTVKASAANSGIVYVGNSDVTKGTVNSTDGFELSAGNSIFIEVNNVNKVYVLGSDVGNRVSWIAV